MNKWLKAWSIFIFTIAGIVVLLIVGAVFFYRNTTYIHGLRKQLYGTKEDDITIQEETNFIEQVRQKVFSYITETFGEPQGMASTPSYALGGYTYAYYSLKQQKKEINEEMFQSFIDYLQHELNVEQAHVNIMYDNEIRDKEF